MTKKTWQEPTIESEMAFETLVSGCQMLNEDESIRCGLIPLTSA